jgi:PEP-CTERM motif
VRRLRLPLALFAALTCVPSLQASLIPVATVDGTLTVHDDVSPATDVSYYRLQFSSTNTNGAALSFTAGPPLNLKPIFGDVGQFGLDAIYTAPTNNTTVPTLTAYDYNGSGPVASPEPINWAVNDYGQHTPVGPGNPANIPYNSLFRGDTINITSQSLTNVGPIYTATLSGDLVSDGFIHWYTPSTPDTSLASLGLENAFAFTATFTDNINTDPSLQTFTGSGIIFAQTPEPAAILLLTSGLAGLVVVTRFARRKARVGCSA